MKFQVKADVLKDMVARAIKGASCNKLIPLTNMISVELNNGELTLHTTDMTNHLYIRKKQTADNFSGDEGAVTVGVETFSKLVGRMTCEIIKFELKGNSLEVKGNGTYNIELPLDENGNPIAFPNPILDELPEKDTIALQDIKIMVNTAKSSLATTMEVPCYTGYYIGDKVITTDTYKICCIDKCLLEEEVLISPEMMNLLDLMEADTIKVYANDSVILFSTPECDVYGYKMDGIEDYQVDAISQLLATPFYQICKVSKDSLLATLDRIALFVGTYDNKAIRLTFTPEGINVSSKKTDGVELVSYTESENFKPFTCLIDIDTLISQVKANIPDTVELHYGHDKFVSITNGIVTQILALLVDTE